MDGVGSGFQLILSNTLGEAILGGEGSLQHSEFLERLKWRIDIKLVALRFREGDGHAIENNFVLKVQPTIDAVAEAIACHARR